MNEDWDDSNHTVGVTTQRYEHVKLIGYLLDKGLITAKTGADEIMKLMNPLPKKLMDKFFIEPDKPYWIDGLYTNDIPL